MYDSISLSIFLTFMIFIFSMPAGLFLKYRINRKSNTGNKKISNNKENSETWCLKNGNLKFSKSIIKQIMPSGIYEERNKINFENKVNLFIILPRLLNRKIILC